MTQPVSTSEPSSSPITKQFIQDRASTLRNQKMRRIVLKCTFGLPFLIVGSLIYAPYDHFTSTRLSKFKELQRKQDTLKNLLDQKNAPSKQSKQTTSPTPLDTRIQELQTRILELERELKKTNRKTVTLLMKNFTHIGVARDFYEIKRQRALLKFCEQLEGELSSQTKSRLEQANDKVEDFPKPLKMQINLIQQQIEKIKSAIKNTEV